MPKLRANAFSPSLDGYGAGPHQDLEHPLGVGGMALHGWLLDLARRRTRTSAAPSASVSRSAQGQSGRSRQQ